MNERAQWLRGLLDELLAQPPHPLKELQGRNPLRSQVPKKGLYLIYEDDSPEPIYVGIGGHAKRKLIDRISEHYSAGKDTSGDSFRRALATKWGIKPGPSLQDWVFEHCRVGWLGLEKKEDALRLEHFATSVFAAQLHYEG